MSVVNIEENIRAYAQRHSSVQCCWVESNLRMKSAFNIAIENCGAIIEEIRKQACLPSW